MQATKKKTSDTSVVLNIVGEAAELQSLKDHVLTHFTDSTKVPGFRAGKAPLAMIEKHINPATLQSEFLEEAINHLLQAAIQQTKIRPINQPEVSLKKFVPFTVLEFDAKVTVIGDVVLPDYKKIKIARLVVDVTSKDVDQVVSSLQKRLAKKQSVDSPAKNGDEVVIDFKGVDDKAQPINGADGKDYPLILGSKSFIPGFEENLIGLKAGDSKTFDISFPKDYGVKALASKKATFTIQVKQVTELIEPKADDTFASQSGPFKTIKELRDDIKKQLKIERQNEADRKHEAEVVEAITTKSKVVIPQELIDDQVERTLRELQQNLTYRGQTYQEYLDLEGKTDEENRKDLIPAATQRVKAGLILTEIADQESLNVTPEELEIRLQILRGQYKDPAMQAELNKPEAKREIASQMLTEKTLKRISGYSNN